MKHIRTHRAAGAALLLGAVLLAAAGAGEPPAAKTYVGGLTGAPASARVALVIGEGHVVAYACSRDEAFNKACGHWFKAPLTSAGAFEAEAAGVRLTGKLVGDAVEGNLTGGDRTLTYRAALVPAGGAAGLYRAEGAATVAGWIVDREHNVVGACKNKQTGKAVALQPKKKLPPPTPDQKEPPAEEVQAAVEAQPDQTGAEALQGARVGSPKQLPKGKKGPSAKKK
jgi:hypothetical protein